MSAAQGLDDGFVVFVGVGLQMRALWVAIADVEKAVGAERAQVFGGFIATIAGGEDLGAGLISFGKQIAALHGGRNGELGSGEREGCHVDLLDQVLADCAPGDAWATDDEGDVGAFIIEELFAAGMADAVVGHENDEGVREEVFFFEAGDDLADVMIGEADGVEVGGPVFEKDRVRWVVGGQGDAFRRGARAELLAGAGCEFTVGFEGVVAEFAAMKLHLHEEGFVTTICPIMAVVDGRVPFEVVIGFAKGPAVGRFALAFSFCIGRRQWHATVIHARQTGADAGVVTCLLEEGGHGGDTFWQVDLYFSPTTAVMMRADGGLVHAGDEGGATGGTDWRRHVSPSEAGAFRREAINMWGLDGGFAITREMCGHVIDDEPQDVW